MKSKSIFSSKIAMMLLSLVIAFSLWLYVITVVSPGSETTVYDVPVVMTGMTVLAEKNLIITDVADTTVDLRLEGNRSDLNKLDKSNITVTLDLTRIYDPGVQNLGYSVAFPGDIPNDAVTTQSKDPGYIRLTVERQVEKEVPVNVVYTGATPEGFVKDKEELDHENITISGPKTVIDKITQAVVQLDLSDKTETVVQTQPYTLCNVYGEEVASEHITIMEDIEEITVTVPIVMIKEIPLKVNVIAGGGATQENTSIKMSHTVLSVSGPEAILSDMKELVLGAVNLGEIEESTVLEFEVKLPEGVTNETGVTKVSAEITFPELETKVLQVTQIHYINLPQGMTAELKAEVVEVTVRGKKSLIKKLTEADITVEVDLSSAQEGTEKYDASIVFAEAFSEVGAMGTYKVTATVAPEQ